MEKIHISSGHCFQEDLLDYFFRYPEWVSEENTPPQNVRDVVKGGSLGNIYILLYLYERRIKINILLRGLQLKVFIWKQFQIYKKSCKHIHNFSI